MLNVLSSIMIFSFRCYNSGTNNIYIPVKDRHRHQPSNISSAAVWFEHLARLVLTVPTLYASTKCFVNSPEETWKGVPHSLLVLTKKMGEQHRPPYVSQLGRAHVSDRDGPAISQGLHLGKDCFAPLHRQAGCKTWISNSLSQVLVQKFGFVQIPGIDFHQLRTQG